jgi:hypothetical protein
VNNPDADKMASFWLNDEPPELTDVPPAEIVAPEPAKAPETAAEPAAVMVEYICWSCGKPSSYERRPGMPEASFMRCNLCAERDGALKLSEWFEIQAATDKEATYQRIMAARGSHK